MYKITVYPYAGDTQIFTDVEDYDVNEGYLVIAHNDYDVSHLNCSNISRFNVVTTGGESE